MVRISIEGLSVKAELLALLKDSRHLSDTKKIYVHTLPETPISELAKTNPAKYSLGYNLHSFIEYCDHATDYKEDEIHIFENSPYTIQWVWSQIL